MKRERLFFATLRLSLGEAETAKTRPISYRYTISLSWHPTLSYRRVLSCPENSNYPGIIVWEESYEYAYNKSILTF